MIQRLITSLLTLMLLLGLIGCSPSKKVANSPKEIFLSQPLDGKNIELKSIATKLATINLEEDFNNKMYSHPQLALVGDSIFVLGSYINIYNLEGEIINSIKAPKNAEGESQSIHRFVVDQTNGDIFASFGRGKIAHFNHSGELIDLVYLDGLKVYSFEYFENNLISLFSNYARTQDTNSLAKVISPTDGVIKSYLPRDKYSKTQRSKMVISNHSEDFISVWEPENDTVYHLTKDGIAPAFVLSMSLDKQYDIRIGTAVVSKVKESTNYLFIAVQTYRKSFKYVYNKRTDELILSSIVNRRGFSFKETEDDLFRMESIYGDYIFSLDKEHVVGQGSNYKLKLHIAKLK